MATVNIFGRFAFGIIIVVFILEIVLLFPKDLGGSNSAATSLANLPVIPKASQVMKKVKLVESEEKKKEWSMLAESALAFRETEDWDLEQVVAQFFGQQGSMFTVTGDHGKIIVKTKNLLFSGNVRIVSSNGYVFLTEEVIYFSEVKNLHCPKPIRVFGPNDGSGQLYLKSGSLKATLSTGEINLLNNVQGHKPIRNDRTIYISSLQAILSGKSKKLQLVGNVVLDLNDLKASGPKASFNYDEKNAKIKSIDMDGGIKVSDKDKFVNANKVHMDMKDNSLIFLGSPSLIQDDDELKGEEIIFLDGGKIVKVIKGKAKFDKKHMEGTKQ